MISGSTVNTLSPGVNTKAIPAPIRDPNVDNFSADDHSTGSLRERLSKAYRMKHRSATAIPIYKGVCSSILSAETVNLYIFRTSGLSSDKFLSISSSGSTSLGNSGMATSSCFEASKSMKSRVS